MTRAGGNSIARDVVMAPGSAGNLRKHGSFPKARFAIPAINALGGRASGASHNASYARLAVRTLRPSVPTQNSAPTDADNECIAPARTGQCVNKIDKVTDKMTDLISAKSMRPNHKSGHRRRTGCPQVRVPAQGLSYKAAPNQATADQGVTGGFQSARRVFDTSNTRLKTRREAKALAFMRARRFATAPEIGRAACRGEPWVRERDRWARVEAIGLELAVGLVRAGALRVTRDNQFATVTDWRAA